MARWLMSVLWPAFLLACVLEVFVFSLVDPSDLHWAGDVLDFSRMGVYSIAFFVFWLTGIGSSALAVLLSMPADADGRAQPTSERRP